MALEIMRDTRVRSVEWRDLIRVSKLEVVRELSLPIPWIALSLWGFHQAVTVHPAWAILALASTFLVFLTGLRVCHNAFHYAIGIPRFAQDFVNFLLSITMLGAMHAVMVNHLHHHKHCMGEDDWEAMSARLKGWQALLLGPIFPIKLHIRAFQIGSPAQVRWIKAELLANVVWLIVVFGLWQNPAVMLFVAAMAVGQCGTAFFAVWTVHHDCDRSHFIGRTVRGRLKSILTYNMFFHVEHHLYPAVPTCHLPELAHRLDAAAPELQEKRVF